MESQNNLTKFVVHPGRSVTAWDMAGQQVIPLELWRIITMGSAGPGC